MNTIHLVAEPGKQVIVVTRVFDAPRDLLFKVYTDPKLIPQWWGPKGFTTKVDKMEVRKGGIWRFIQRDVNGNEIAFNGVYHEISAPERVINTFEYEPMPGHVILEIVKFEEHDGKTTLIGTYVYMSLEDRDGMLMSGMEGGEAETYDRLEELLVKALGVARPS